MADKELAEEDSGHAPEYKVSKEVTVEELVNRDNDDESLRKYKETLLGKAATEKFSPANDPRRVVITEFRIICEGRPGGDIVYPLADPAAVEAMKSNGFALKEGCNYKFMIKFRVQHEIVSGLKYVNHVTRKGIPVGKDELMIGSYAPQSDPHTMVFPRNGWEEAPSGMLARGSYKGKSKFIDDDKRSHLEFEYAFDIKKDW